MQVVESLSRTEKVALIKRLVDYANNLGFIVLFDKNHHNIVNPFTNEVQLKLVDDLNLLILTLSHEIGHCIDLSNHNFDIKRYSYEYWYRLKKEIEAWKHGFKLLSDMNVRMKPKYILKSVKCISSYINFF